MISLAELNPKKFETTPEIDANLATLLTHLNEFRAIYGLPLSVTSGLRSMADHKRIYANKGITDEKKIPMSSKHLFGLAVDFADKDGSLYKYAFDNKHILEQCGLWCEEGTVGWLHMQCVPPKSGNRFFKP
jgi:uncharacterized protein YcbK (DUF882 family)